MNPESNPKPTPVADEEANSPMPSDPRFSEALDRCSPVAMNPDEHVIQVVYRHPINLLPIEISTGLILILAAFASYNIGLYADRVSRFLAVGTVMTILGIVAGLAVLTFVIAYFIYRQNRVVLTNQNLLQVEQYGLFNRVVSKLSLVNLEDVTGARKGLFATLLNYGNLIVETAGEEENFVFEQAPNPAELVEAINKAHEDILSHRRLNREQVSA